MKIEIWINSFYWIVPDQSIDKSNVWFWYLKFDFFMIRPSILWSQLPVLPYMFFFHPSSFTFLRNPCCVQCLSWEKLREFPECRWRCRRGFSDSWHEQLVWKFKCLDGYYLIIYPYYRHCLGILKELWIGYDRILVLCNGQMIVLDERYFFYIITYYFI